MKLCLLFCAAVALADQDVTPPVMSITMPGTTFQHKTNNAFSTGEHGSDRVHGFERQGSSVTCEVGDSAEDIERCPMPNCTIYDHHDEFLSWNAATSAFQKVSSLADSRCKETYYLVNDDGNTDTGNNATASIHRQLRSEWLIKYDAEDLSGNPAEQLSFTMVFKDTMAPELTTQFGTSYLWAKTANKNNTFAFDKDDYNWLQSCSHARKADMTAVECGANIDIVQQANHGHSASIDGTSSCANINPCVYFLDTSGAHTAVDKYDGDVKGNTKVTVTDPDGTKRIDNESLETVFSNNNKYFIDTHQLGDWVITYTSCDDAEEFGFNGQSNCGTQTVTLTVADTVAPVITVLDETTGSDIVYPAGHSEFDENTGGTVADFACSNDGAADYDACTVECVWAAGSGCGKYTEPKATCHDDRDSFKPVDPGNGNAPSGNYSDAWASLVTDAPSDADNTLCIASKTLYTTASENVHNVEYYCEDAATNEATNKTRVVTVVDRVPPTITLLHDRQIQVSAGSVDVTRHYIQNSAGTDATHKNSTGHSQKTVFESEGSLLDLVMLVTPGQGVSCEDRCSQTASTQITAKLYHGKHCNEEGGTLVQSSSANTPNGAVDLFPEYEAGDYSILYTCYDGTGAITQNGTHFDQTDDTRTPLTASQCRYIDNVDHTRPIIQILGSDDMTLEATHTGNYVDDGATCFDAVDGPISQNVEVSGDVVNLSKVGTYEIVYNCKDARGNSADPLTRTVHIAQTACPRCTVNECSNDNYNNSAYDCSMDHEASFDYTMPVRFATIKSTAR